MSKPRQNINIEVTDLTRNELQAIRDWNGMTQKEIAGRLIAWFGRQDRVTQQVILGQIPDEIAPDIAVTLLHRMAQGEGTRDHFDRDEQDRNPAERPRQALALTP